MTSGISSRDPLEGEWKLARERRRCRVPGRCLFSAQKGLTR